MGPKLDSLSVDELGPVLDLLDAYSVTYLWFMGSRTLNVKMSHALRSFNLQYRSVDRHYWPTIISSFPGLHHLQIRDPPIFGKTYVQRIKISTLPKTLRS